MAEQRPLTEQEFNALVTRVIESAPAGLDEATFTAMLDNEVAKAEQAVAAQPKRPEQFLAESEPDYMGNDPNLGTRALANAPTIGAMLATMLGPAGFVPGVGMAMLGGAGGSLLRGDDLGDAAISGAKEGALQFGGGAALKMGRGIARGLMKGAGTKPIAKEYPNINLPKEMLDRGVLPGVEDLWSPLEKIGLKPARRVSQLSTAANAEREAAAQIVPVMPRRKVIEGLRPEYARAVTAKEPKIANAALEHMRESARNIGREGLTGPQALARKDIKQDLASAALNNPDTAAFAPRFNNAERGAIVSHLRETPRMETALNESQIWKAINEVMQDASYTNPITRMKMGGLGGALTVPVGLGVTAHAVNQGAQVFNPQVRRALEILLRSRSGESPRRRQP